MKAFELKYGCNPNQKPAWLDMPDGRSLPFEYNIDVNDDIADAIGIAHAAVYNYDINFE